MSPPPVEPIILTGIGTDASNVFVDLSGLSTPPTSTTPPPTNPYNTLLTACPTPSLVSTAYSRHRTARNAAQSTTLTSTTFKGTVVDPILSSLTSTSPSLPADVDPRNCLVFWARPPAHVMGLIAYVQSRLAAAPPPGRMWRMPRENLHLTVLELTHSTTEEFVHSLVAQIGAVRAKDMVEHVRTHRARLVRPMVSFDAAAVAVSFLPSPAAEDAYTYHHLRRDFYSLSKAAGVGVTSRYVVPSAHVTIARFTNCGKGECGQDRMKRWVQVIEEINKELEGWEGSWVVGEERGVDFRMGRLWYGGGETVVQGMAFEVDRTKKVEAENAEGEK